MAEVFISNAKMPVYQASSINILLFPVTCLIERAVMQASGRNILVTQN